MQFGPLDDVEFWYIYQVRLCSPSFFTQSKIKNHLAKKQLLETNFRVHLFLFPLFFGLMASSSSTTTIDDSNNEDIGMYFLEMSWFKGLELDEDVDDDKEEAPTAFKAVNSEGEFVVIPPEKLSMKHSSDDALGNSFGIVQGNKAAPMKRFLYYLEIHVKDAGPKGRIAIGFTNGGDELLISRMLGRETVRFGYHGHDGRIYGGKGKAEAVGPTYTTGDTVGAGINYGSQEFFFTKNGQIVGKVPMERAFKAPFYPTISVCSQEEEVDVNFGPNEFAFRLMEYEAQQRLRQQKTIQSIKIEPSRYYGLVRQYLLHYGYEDTLQSLDVDLERTMPPGMSVNFSNENFQLNTRKNVRQLIRNGQIDQAIEDLRGSYPRILQDEKSALCCLLCCQKFIELVQGARVDEALHYARAEFENFMGLAKYFGYGKDCFALLMFPRPLESPSGYFLSDSHRDIVADAVNAAILSCNGLKCENCLHTNLEKALRRLTVYSSEKRARNGGQGEVFQLHRWLRQ